MPFKPVVALSDIAPVTQVEGDVASPGTGAQASRYDHRHGMPSTYTPSLAHTFLVPYHFHFSTTVDSGTHATLYDHGIEVGIDGVVGDVQAYAQSEDTYLYVTFKCKTKISWTPGEVSNDVYYFVLGFNIHDVAPWIQMKVDADRCYCHNSADGVAASATAVSGLFGTTEADYEIVWTSSEIKFYKDGALVATHTSNIPTSAITVNVQARNKDTAVAGTYWGRVRWIEVS